MSRPRSYAHNADDVICLELARFDLAPDELDRDLANEHHGNGQVLQGEFALTEVTDKLLEARDERSEGVVVAACPVEVTKLAGERDGRVDVHFIVVVTESGPCGRSVIEMKRFDTSSLLVDVQLEGTKDNALVSSQIGVRRNDDGSCYRRSGCS